MQFAKFTIAAIMIGCLSFFPTGTAFAQTKAAPVSPVQEAVTDQKVVIDLPQRTFLIGEPINIFVGLTNNADTTVVISNITDKLSLKVTTPIGKLAWSSLHSCGGSFTSIRPHETLWVHFDLVGYNNLNLRGKHTVTAKMEGNESEAVEITLVEPTGQDKSALDWIRLKVATDTERIESKTDRAQRATMLSQSVINEKNTLAKIFPDSVLGQYAEYYRTDERYHITTNSGSPNKKDVESVLQAYRSIAEMMPDTQLAILARIGEMRCLSLLGQLVEPPTELMKSGFARQEIATLLEPSQTQEK